MAEGRIGPYVRAMPADAPFHRWLADLAAAVAGPRAADAVPADLPAARVARGRLGLSPDALWIVADDDATRAALGVDPALPPGWTLVRLGADGPHAAAVLDLGGPVPRVAWPEGALLAPSAETAPHAVAARAAGLHPLDVFAWTSGGRTEVVGWWQARPADASPDPLAASLRASPPDPAPWAAWGVHGVDLAPLCPATWLRRAPPQDQDHAATPLARDLVLRFDALPPPQRAAAVVAAAWHATRAARRQDLEDAATAWACGTGPARAVASARAALGASPPPGLDPEVPAAIVPFPASPSWLASVDDALAADDPSRLRGPPGLAARAHRSGRTRDAQIDHEVREALAARAPASAPVDHLAALATRAWTWTSAQGHLAVTDPGSLVGDLLLDGLAAAAAVPPHARSLLDIGTGLGVPGLVIACVRPDLDALLLDDDPRRVAHVDRTARDLGLDRLRAQVGRSEALDHRADVVTVRRIGTAADGLALAAPHVAAGGCALVLDPPTDTPPDLTDAAHALGLHATGSTPVLDARGVAVAWLHTVTRHAITAR